MKILSIDTSNAPLAIALVEDKQLVAETTLNITKNHRCKTIMKEVSKSITHFGNERECKIFYEYHDGVTVFCDYSVQFEKLQDLESEQEIIDKEKYGFNYIETTLDEALEVFKLQNKK